MNLEAKLYKNGLPELDSTPVLLAIVQAFIILIVVVGMLKFLSWWSDLLGGFHLIPDEMDIVVAAVIALTYSLYSTIFLSRPLLVVDDDRLKISNRFGLFSKLDIQALKAIQLRRGDEEQMYFDISFQNGLKATIQTSGYYGEKKEIIEFIWLGTGLNVQT